MVARPTPDRTLLVLIVAAFIAAASGAVHRPPPRMPDRPDPAVAWVKPANAYQRVGEIIQAGTASGERLLWSQSPHGPLDLVDGSDLQFEVAPDEARSARLHAIPTALQWRHPLPGPTSAMLLRLSAHDPGGGMRGERLHTILTVDHRPLPVISLFVPEGALFDPDSGIYVPGNAMLHPTSEMIGIYDEDFKWWKYPGNYHFRGRTWEREAKVQFIDGMGQSVHQDHVGLRINGNMSRGFAQHALRIQFADPLPVDLFPHADGMGSRTVILRAAGNDHNKAFLRDALAHRLCQDALFMTSKAVPSVLYVNGAYWGLHHLRQRIDEDELARRYGGSRKNYEIVESELKHLHGDPVEVLRLRALLEAMRNFDGQHAGTLERIRSELDVDGFLDYMASCMIMGARDWPRRNVRVWRWTGPPQADGPKDGRWRCILNDADLALGAQAGADADLFHQLDRDGFLAPDLFRALIRHLPYRDRFAVVAQDLLLGRFTTDRMTMVLDDLVERMEPEMPRHIARWRKPASIKAWQQELDVIRMFIRDRPSSVRKQLKAWTKY